jgi:hypothetical protein
MVGLLTELTEPTQLIFAGGTPCLGIEQMIAPQGTA